MLFTLSYKHEAASRTAAQPMPCMLFKGKVATSQTGCTWAHNIALKCINANHFVRQASSAHQGWLLSPMLPARPNSSISISSTVSWPKSRVITWYTLSRGCHPHSAKQQQDDIPQYHASGQLITQESTLHHMQHIKRLL